MGNYQTVLIIPRTRKYQDRGSDAVLYCFLNQLYSNGVYDVIAVSSEEQVADVGCAPRSLPVFQRHRAALRGEQK